MNQLKIAIAFAVGAGLGCFGTYRYLKDKYEKIAQEEIDSVKERYSEKKPAEENQKNNSEAQDDKKREAEMARQKPDISEYAKKLSENRYVNYSDTPDERKKSNNYEYIAPEDFGDIEDYDTISLTYYSDGILADDDDEIIEDFLDLVGNFTTHFGEYDDDLVFVRNDDRSTYYEILRDMRKYTDVVMKKPRKYEDEE